MLYEMFLSKLKKNFSSKKVIFYHIDSNVLCLIQLLKLILPRKLFPRKLHNYDAKMIINKLLLPLLCLLKVAYPTSNVELNN